MFEHDWTCLDRNLWNRCDCGNGARLGRGTWGTFRGQFIPGASGAAKLRGQEQSLRGFCGGDPGLGELPGDAGAWARRVCNGQGLAGSGRVL